MAKIDSQYQYYSCNHDLNHTKQEGQLFVTIYNLQFIHNL